ncbi:MAG: Hint domain-containing protein [Sphingobium sp.]|nr:Hint domain-containing protein [Sphingobium sp.]
MADFELNQLNNVTFSADAFARVSAWGDGPPPSNAQQGVKEIYEAGDPSGTPGPMNPGTVTVLTSQYTAGFYVDYEGYTMPTFGSIQFSDILDGSDNPVTFWVHGFTENGLLITNSETMKAESGHFTTGDSFKSYIVSNYGFGPGGLSLPATFDKNATVYAAPPVCFVEGTRLTVPGGQKSVEHLEAGEFVQVLSGEFRQIKWVGMMIVRPRRYADPKMAYPVFAKAHAFGENIPFEDVGFSPGHSLFVDGVLVPVGKLVNGATIVQEAIEEVRYWHIELETHDIVLAAGLPAESYLPDGNRRAFGNAGKVVELDGSLDPQNWDNAYAPMVAAGPQLAEIRRRLQVQAEALNWVLSETADLTLEADGVRYSPVKVVDGCYAFEVPVGADWRIRSNHSVLSAVMPSVTDDRDLGVAISEIRIDGTPLDLAGEEFGEGFTAIERNDSHAWRWTNGAAMLRIGDRRDVRIELSVLMTAPNWQRAPEALLEVA